MESPPRKGGTGDSLGVGNLGVGPKDAVRTSGLLIDNTSSSGITILGTATPSEFT